MSEPTATYDASEQDVLLDVFRDMLAAVTKDGGNKRARGEKPPWWRDAAHEAAIFSHLNKWKHDELLDPDSNVHPLVHGAWRMLAIAYQETYGRRDPANRYSNDWHRIEVSKVDFSSPDVCSHCGGVAMFTTGGVGEFCTIACQTAYLFKLQQYVTPDSGQHY